jgi:hypothetical protein
MAYPTVSSPYGLKPVNLIGGRVFAGSTRMFPIVNGYSTSLFNGDVVQLGATSANTGNLIASTLAYNGASAVAGTIGVFVGAEYSSVGGPIYGKNRYQYWNASTAATDAIGYVVDDPQAVFQSVVLSNPAGTGGSTTIGYINPSYIGSNAYYIGAAAGNTGLTTTGDSLAGIAISAAAIGTGSVSPLTSSAPFRIVGVVPASAVTVTQNATSSTNTLTLSAANSAIQVGMAVSGPGINAGNNTYVITVNGTTVTLNQNVTTTQSSSAQFSFTGYPEALVTWNFGYHSYFNATGV